MGAQHAYRGKFPCTHPDTSPHGMSMPMVRALGRLSIFVTLTQGKVDGIEYAYATGLSQGQAKEVAARQVLNVLYPGGY